MQVASFCRTHVFSRESCPPWSDSHEVFSVLTAESLVSLGQSMPLDSYHSTDQRGSNMVAEHQSSSSRHFFIISTSRNAIVHRCINREMGSSSSGFHSLRDLVSREEEPLYQSIGDACRSSSATLVPRKIDRPYCGVDER